jgi:hypothetical protein
MASDGDSRSYLNYYERETTLTVVLYFKQKLLVPSLAIRNRPIDFQLASLSSK